MNDFILETENLSKRFGRVTAVDQVSLGIHSGEIFGFLGPNGAGKTTTIGMILSLIWPTAGQVRLFGRPVTPDDNRPLQQVGALTGAPALVPYLSARGNLELLARLYPEIGRPQIEAMLERVGLNEAAGRAVKGYSTGMKQRLGLAAALLHHPRLLILDEPTNGLDPAGMREIRELLRQLADDGMTIFLSSHLLHEVEQICDRVAILRQGQVVAQGSVAELLGGGHQVVRLWVPEPRVAQAAVEQLSGAGPVRRNGSYIEVDGLPSETLVAHLVGQGIVPSQVTVEQSDLEERFLQLTSRQ